MCLKMELPLLSGKNHAYFKQKKAPSYDKGFKKAGDETRTHNLQLGRLLLYQLSYSRVVWGNFKKEWVRCQGESS